MDFNIIVTDFSSLANKDEALKMNKYMRGQFAFLGVRSPQRKKFCRTLFQSLTNDKVDWEFISKCWAAPYREFKYIAADYLHRVRSKLLDEDLVCLAQLIKTESWWDTTDSLDSVVGHLVLRYPHLVNTMRDWGNDDNLWIRRVALTHQLNFKTDTNIELLSSIIESNLGSSEFFINKAIGWALREYSKTNPHWVAEFITLKMHELHPLSIREGKKHLLRSITCI